MGLADDAMRASRARLLTDARMTMSARGQGPIHDILGMQRLDKPRGPQVEWMVLTHPTEHPRDLKDEAELSATRYLACALGRLERL